MPGELRERPRLYGGGHSSREGRSEFIQRTSLHWRAKVGLSKRSPSARTTGRFQKYRTTGLEDRHRYLSKGRRLQGVEESGQDVAGRHRERSENFRSAWTWRCRI